MDGTCLGLMNLFLLKGVRCQDFAEIQPPSVQRQREREFYGTYIPTMVYVGDAFTSYHGKGRRVWAGTCEEGASGRHQNDQRHNG